MPGADIPVRLAGLENAHISGLMAGHADVVCEIGSKTGGIDNFAVERFGGRIFLRSLSVRAVHGFNVSGSRAVASFAANGQLGKWRALELPITSCYGIWPAGQRVFNPRDFPYKSKSLYDPLDSSRPREEMP